MIPDKELIEGYYDYFLKAFKSIEIRVFHETKEEYKLGKSFFVTNKNDFVSEVIRLNQEEELNVYIGYNERVKGGKADKNVISCKYIVIDVDDLKDIDKDLEELNLKYDWKVASGGGYHYYIPILEQNDLIKIRELYQKIKELLKQNNTAVDNKAFNPSRVIRVVGTINHKRNKLCELVDCKTLEEEEDKKNNLKIIDAVEVKKIVCTSTPPVSCPLIEYLKTNKLEEEDISKNDVLIKNIALFLRPLGENGKDLGRQITEFQGHNAVEFDGWFDSPNVDNFNCQELQNWITQYDLMDLIPLCKNCVKNKKVELKYPTTHLPHFKILEKALGLFGKEYKPIKKLLYYHLIGTRIKGNMITFGSIKTDSRISPIFMMNSGRGKNNIKQICKSVFPIPFKISEAVSLHPEQLIGKVVKNKSTNQQTKKIEGYFASDELILDESRLLFTSHEQKHAEIRGYTCIALDTMGHNAIHKQMVEYGSEDALEYFANCSVVLFTQPLLIKKDVIESGFLRRFLMINCDEKTNFKEIYKARLKGENRDSFISEFQEYLISVDLGNSEKEWVFEKEVENKLDKYVGMLCDMGLEHSEKGSNYIRKIYHQTLLDVLLKFSCISAAYSQSDRLVKIEDVEKAYIDLFELLYLNLDCINLYTEWFYEFGIQYRELNILKWLYNSDAISLKKSNIGIESLKQKMGENNDVGIEQSAKYYQKLKRKDLIKSKQIGKNETKVWLSEKGVNSVELGMVKSADDSYYMEYLRLCEKYEGSKGSIINL
jgi:hypothetical protein